MMGVGSADQIISLTGWGDPLVIHLELSSVPFTRLGLGRA